MMKVNLNLILHLRRRSSSEHHRLLLNPPPEFLTSGTRWSVTPPPSKGTWVCLRKGTHPVTVSARHQGPFSFPGVLDSQWSVLPVRHLHSKTNSELFHSGEPAPDNPPEVTRNPKNQEEEGRRSGVSKEDMLKAEVKENEGEPFREKARPFEEMPGPSPKPFVGNKLLFTPLGGYSLRDFWDTCRRLHDRFGSVVRLARLASDRDIVYVFDPEDVRKIYEAEGPLPSRPTFDILTYYRSQRPQWFSSAGLVPGNGPEWQRLRRAVQPLLRRQVVAAYRRDHARVAADLVSTIRRHQELHDGGVADVLPMLFKYTLEAVGVVALATRLGCLQTEESHKLREEEEEEEEEQEEAKGRGGQVVAANTATLTALGEAFFALPFYRIFPTKLFRRLAGAQDVIAEIVEKELSRIEHERGVLGRESFDKRHPFLASLFRRDDFDRKDVMLVVYEVFQGGIDATATTLAFCLYYLARNPIHQEALYAEVKDVDTATHNLQGLPYLRAVLREVLRLRPSAAAAARIIARDAVIGGYHIPKGTLVQGPPIIACRDPAVFPDPETFEPGRWLPEGYKNPGGRVSRAPKNASGSRAEDFESPKWCPGVEWRDDFGETSAGSSSEADGAPTRTKRKESAGDPPEEALSAGAPSDAEVAPPGTRRKGGGPRGSVHPYTVLPFGHGRRMCPGRRFAEQEIFIALVQILQAYKVEYVRKVDRVKDRRGSEEEEEDVGQVFRLNMEPDRAIGIQFFERLR